MSLYAYNKTLAALPLPTVSPVVTLPIATAAPSVGARGKAFDVTSELRPNLTVDPINGVAGGLTAAQLAAIQLKVADGSAQFEWTGLPEFNTVTLVVGSAQTDNDDIDFAIYVNPTTGSDTNPGTLGQPVATLVRAFQIKPISWRKSCRIYMSTGNFPFPDPTGTIGPNTYGIGGTVGPNATPLAIIGTPVDASSPAAIGSITAIAGALLVDGETFTISDGVNPAKVFEFDLDGAGVIFPNVAVVYTALSTATQVRDAIIAAINGAALLNVTASDGSATVVSLINDVAGPVGNVAITDTVANVGFLVTGMAVVKPLLALVANVASTSTSYVANISALVGVDPALNSLRGAFLRNTSQPGSPSTMITGNSVAGPLLTCTLNLPLTVVAGDTFKIERPGSVVQVPNAGGAIFQGSGFIGFKDVKFDSLTPSVSAGVQLLVFVEGAAAVLSRCEADLGPQGRLIGALDKGEINGGALSLAWASDGASNPFPAGDANAGLYTRSSFASLGIMNIANFAKISGNFISDLVNTTIQQNSLATIVNFQSIGSLLNVINCPSVQVVGGDMTGGGSPFGFQVRFNQSFGRLGGVNTGGGSPTATPFVVRNSAAGTPGVVLLLSTLQALRLTGTGNGTYGISVLKGSSVDRNAVCTITGLSGDMLVGVVPRTYAQLPFAETALTTFATGADASIGATNNITSPTLGATLADVGSQIAITGSATPANNNTFLIDKFISATSVEVSPIAATRTGTYASVAASSRITGLTLMTAADVGKRITLTGLNAGTFLIDKFVSATEVEVSPVVATLAGIYLTVGATNNITGLDIVMTAADVGKRITLAGGTVGTFLISEFVSASEVRVAATLAGELVGGTVSLATTAPLVDAVGGNFTLVTTAPLVDAGPLTWTLKANRPTLNRTS